MEMFLVILSFAMGLVLVFFLGGEHGFQTAKKRYGAKMEEMIKKHEEHEELFDILCDISENGCKLIYLTFKEMPEDYEVSEEVMKLYVEHIQLSQKLLDREERLEREEKEI